MQATVPSREEIVGKIALAIDGALLDWQEGRATSPDQRDYVILATEVFTQHFTGYVPTDREEEIADAIYDRESMGDWGVRDIAEALYDDLHLGAPALAE